MGFYRLILHPKLHFCAQLTTFLCTIQIFITPKTAVKTCVFLNCNFFVDHKLPKVHIFPSRTVKFSIIYKKVHIFLHFWHIFLHFCAQLRAYIYYKKVHILLQKSTYLTTKRYIPFYIFMHN